MKSTFWFKDLLAFLMLLAMFCPNITQLLFKLAKFLSRASLETELSARSQLANVYEPKVKLCFEI